MLRSGSLRLVIFLALCTSLFFGGLPAHSQTTTNINKVVSLLQTDQYDFKTTRSPSVWTVDFKGEHMGAIKVIVALGEGDDALLVIFVTAVEKRRLHVTTDFMRTLLEQTHNYDRVKIEYDHDGDLSVRIDSSLRVTDAKEFRVIVDQVKNASDELYGTIAPQLLN